MVGAGLVLDFFLVLDAGGCSVMCAGIGAVTDFGMYIAAGVIAFAGEAVADLSSAFWGDFFFFSSDFYPLLHCLRLGLVRFFFTSGLADGGYGSCCCCSFCSSWSFWWIFFGAELGYVPQLLAAPTARASAFRNHHHLPLSGIGPIKEGNQFWVEGHNCRNSLFSRADVNDNVKLILGFPFSNSRLFNVHLTLETMTESQFCVSVGCDGFCKSVSGLIDSSVLSLFLLRCSFSLALSLFLLPSVFLSLLPVLAFIPSPSFLP